MEYSSQTTPDFLSLNPETLSPQKTAQTVTMSPETEQIETTIDILIVDDVLENVRLLSSILADHGYPTRKATSGLMALRAVEITQPTLILLDIRMPNLSGYAVCQQLKSNPKTAHIPIIFLSATENIEDKAKAFQVGGSDYISKPFYVEEVVARVQHQLKLIAAQKIINKLNKQLDERRVKERLASLEISQSKLLEMAFHDSLTQLPNRAFLMRRLEETLQQQQTYPHAQFAAFYLDCDGFKEINDSFGHAVGDELLIAISQRLRLSVRQNDFIARLGGDEFVIILPNITDPKITLQIAERIVENFNSPFQIQNQAFLISFSVGIILDSSSYFDPHEILIHADQAMYQAKSQGKACYHVFGSSSN